MVKSRLSEEEEVQVIAFVATGNAKGLVDYLNQLLYQKGRGTDCCARPLALRDREDLKDTCFAEGYIKKIIEFMDNSRQRLSPAEAVEATCKYLDQILNEIGQFFGKRG